MLKITKKTKMKPEDVTKKAVRFFGPIGYGLEITEQTETCASFEGGGGYISITTCLEGEITSVDIETREWEYQVKEFIGKLK